MSVTPVTVTPENRGAMKIHARVEAREADGTLIGISDNPDIGTIALAQLMQTNIIDIGSSQSIIDVTNTSRTVTINAANTAPVIVAGTTGTAPTFADPWLGDHGANTDYHTNSSYCQAGTVNAIAANGAAANAFNITAVIGNVSGSPITYKEIGMAITNAAVSGKQYLIAHDQVNSGTGFTVSSGGSLTVTYTLTFT